MIRRVPLALFVSLTLATLTAAPSAAAIAVQRLGFCGGDDWEPTVATASGGHVYALITHFKGDPLCDPASARNGSRIMIQVSSDRGRTFSAPRVVSEAPAGINYPFQADPAIAVDARTGAVYVAFLAFGLSGGHGDVYVAKSSDHGATFPLVTKVNSHDCGDCDHEKILAGGSTIYLAYSQGQRHFVAVSTNSAVSFAQTTVFKQHAVAFAEGGVLDASGNAWFAWGDCESSNCTGVPAVDYRVSQTFAGTARTIFSPIIATSPQAPDCPFQSCGFAYFGGQDAIGIDAGGTLYLVWQDGQHHAVRKSPPVMRLSSCTAGCTSASGWHTVGRVDDKTASGCPGASCYALFPSIIGGGAGRIAVTWMDDRNDAADGAVEHTDGWNLWYRTSTDGGRSWSSAGVRVSRFDPTESQSGPAGFLFPYGDYAGLAPNPACRGGSVAVWGEGHDWVGGPSAPGHVELASLC